MSVEQKKTDASKEQLIAEIERRLAYLLSTNDYTLDEKEAIARRFFQVLEGAEKCNGTHN